MQGLRIFSRSGEALSSEEIDAAHRVATTHKEMRFGVITSEDPVYGIKVEFHPLKRIAFTQPGRISFWYPCNAVTRITYRTVNAMGIYTGGIPEPTPGSVWPVDITVFTSDGEILAVQPGTLEYGVAPTFGSKNYNYVGNVPQWSGGGYRYAEEFPAAIPVIQFLGFTIPDDIAMPPVGSFFLSTEYPLSDDDRASSNERLRQYILGFSDATLQKLAEGEVEPHVAKAIKDSHPNLGLMAEMSRIITGSSSDLVISETIDELYAERTIERTVNLTYLGTDGEEVSIAVVGTLKLETFATDAMNGGGYYADFKATYTDFPAFNEEADTYFDRTGPSYDEWLYPEPSTDFIFGGWAFRAKYLDPEYMIQHHDAPLIESKTSYPLMAIINGIEQDNPSSLASAANGGTGIRYTGDYYSNIESEYLLSSQDGVFYPGGMRQVVGDDISITNHPYIIQYRSTWGVVQSEENSTIEEVYALFGISSLEELYALYGVSTEQEFLEVLGFYTMQAAINSLMENPGGNPSKLDCGLLDGELVTIYPYEQIKRDGLNYGIYAGQYTGNFLESTPTDVIRFSKGYAFRYKFSDGSYTFVKTKAIVDKRLDPPIEVETVEFDISGLSNPQKNEFLLRNFIVLSSRRPTGFAEIDATYRAQATGVNDESSFDEDLLTLMGLYHFLS
jgi:hypothetical protein